MNKYIRQGCQEEREWELIGMSDKSTCRNRDSEQSCTNQNAKWRRGDSPGRPKAGAWERLGPCALRTGDRCIGDYRGPRQGGGKILPADWTLNRKMIFNLSKCVLAAIWIGVS